MNIRHESPVLATVAAGAAAGLVAAIVSSVPGLLYVLGTDETWYRPVQLIATLVGLEQRGGLEWTPFLIGGAIHLMLSVVYGVAFSLVTARLSVRALLPLGAAFGLAIYLVNFEVAGLLGWFDELRAGTHSGVELAAHLMFGLTVAAVLRFRAGSSMVE